MLILPPEPGPVPPIVHSLWNPRVHPGTPATAASVRADLRRDLARLPGLGSDLTESIVLCVSEMFANAYDHSRSGEEGGRVVRTLTLPREHTLRLSVVDDGHRDTGTRPRIPHQRTVEEWQEAERGRGLLIISHLAARWGSRRVVDFPFCAGLGTVLWADFDLPGGPAVDPDATASTASPDTRYADAFTPGASVPEDAR